MDFCGTQDTPTPLFIDNSAAISMGKVPQFSEKQKHIPIRICHLKECCADGMIELRPVPTRNELDDIGTKALAWPALVSVRKLRDAAQLHLHPAAAPAMETLEEAT